MAIKSTLVTPPNKAKEIDWSIEGQLLIDNLGQVVSTTGEHAPNTFTAVALAVVKRNNFCLLKASDDWAKESFKTITTPITITFENE